MTPTQKKRDFRRDLVLAALMIVTGFGMSGVALTQLSASVAEAGRVPMASSDGIFTGTGSAGTTPIRLAQATPPLQSTPGAESKPSAPASDTTTGQRPHEIPPQPARPDADARAAGATPALPAAPAEKVAPPITTK